MQQEKKLRKNSKIGHFEELPVKKDAKQASRVYTTEQLYEMFKIICTELDTDVSLTTLTMIFRSNSRLSPRRFRCRTIAKSIW